MSSVQDDSSHNNIQSEEREKDLFNKLDTKMIDEDDDFELMGNSFVTHNYNPFTFPTSFWYHVQINIPSILKLI